MSLTGTGNIPNYLVIQTEYLNARTQYQNAENALEQAQKRVAENEEKIAEDMTEAEEEKTQLEDQLEAFEEFVGEDSVLYASEEGIITQVEYEDGDTLEQNGTILSYAAPADMTITVDMTQEDVVALTVGDNVEVTFTAYPEDIYAGTILSIDTTATSRNSYTISYQVVIGVEGDTSTLYGGMTADITFVTEEKDDVCYVSRKAIVEQDGKTYVYVKDGISGRELKQVETGLSNGIYIEIVSGLEEGDTIYIASKVSSEAEIQAQEESQTDADSGADGVSPWGEMEVPEDFNPGDMFGGNSSGQMPGGNSPGQMPGGGSSSGQKPGGNSGRGGR